MTDILEELARVKRDADRWRANHKDAVETKRGTDARLRVTLAALQQIYDVCTDNAPESCNQRMALDFVRQVAGDAFEKATHDVPRKIWTAQEMSNALTPAQSDPVEKTGGGA
jgi:hypothetical protein